MAGARRTSTAFSPVKSPPSKQSSPRHPPTPAATLRPDLALRALAATSIAVALCTAAPAARAQPVAQVTTPVPPRTAPQQRLVEVRLSLSRAAADALGETRVRRLLEIELDDTGSLASSPGGPLSDQVAHVWVDLPSPSQVVIEARMAERPVSRRFIATSDLNPDVAARLVAIAASELVRAQARPLRPRRPPAPRVPSREELDRAARRAPALVWSAAPSFALLPATGGALWGAGASLGFGALGASERIFARWLAGPTDTSTLRWFEVGLALDYRVPLHRSVRLVLGGDASLAFLRLPDARATGGVMGAREALSGRAGGALGLEVRAFGSAWASLRLSPGAVLRSTSLEDATGRRGAVEGFWLGVDLGLHIEHLIPTSAPTNR